MVLLHSRGETLLILSNRELRRFFFDFTKYCGNLTSLGQVRQILNTVLSNIVEQLIGVNKNWFKKYHFEERALFQLRLTYLETNVKCYHSYTRLNETQR